MSSKRKKFRRGRSGKSFALKEDSEIETGEEDEMDDTPMDFEAQQTFTFDNGMIWDFTPIMGPLASHLYSITVFDFLQ